MDDPTAAAAELLSRRKALLEEADRLGDLGAGFVSEANARLPAEPVPAG